MNMPHDVVVVVKNAITCLLHAVSEDSLYLMGVYVHFKFVSLKLASY